MFYPLETIVIFNVIVFFFLKVSVPWQIILLSPHAVYLTSTPPFDCSCLLYRKIVSAKRSKDLLLDFVF